MTNRCEFCGVTADPEGTFWHASGCPEIITVRSTDDEERFMCEHCGKDPLPGRDYCSAACRDALERCGDCEGFGVVNEPIWRDRPCLRKCWPCDGTGKRDRGAA